KQQDFQRHAPDRLQFRIGAVNPRLFHPWHGFLLPADCRDIERNGRLGPFENAVNEPDEENSDGGIRDQNANHFFRAELPSKSANHRKRYYQNQGHEQVHRISSLLPNRSPRTRSPNTPFSASLEKAAQ